MKKAPIAEIEVLLEKHRGNVAAVARHFGVSRGTIYNRMKESPRLEVARADAQETFVDDVESALFNNALDGNVSAQIFIMKAHPAAKRRGWGERTEFAGPDGGAVALLVEYVNDWRGASDRSSLQDSTSDCEDARH